METVIEKAVELGVYEIIPVAMKYCVKLEGKKAAQRVQKMAGGRDCKQNSQSAVSFQRFMK